MLVCCALVTCHAKHAFFTPVKFHFTQGQPPGTDGERVPTIGIVAAEGGRAEGGPRPLYYPAPPTVGSAFFPPISPEHHLSPEGKPKGGGGAVETDEQAGETRAASLLSSLEGLCVNREVDHITFEVSVMYASATAEPFLARVFPRFIERYPFFHNAPFAMYDTTLVGNYVSLVSLAKYDA